MPPGEHATRLLHRNAAQGYTTSTSMAMRHEPQALTVAEQDAMSAAAHDRELRAWQVSRARILAEIDHLCQHVHGPEVKRTARALERQLDAFERKLIV